MEFPNGKGNLRLLVWVVGVADSQTRSKPNWRQSCDKSTVKLSTTVAFCDMSTVNISTVYLSTVYFSTPPTKTTNAITAA